MKKSLFAVAAMTAFATAAQAQSSVTVSGVIDESYTSVKQVVGGAAGAPSRTVQGLKDSAWTSNRLIFAGNEDMGGGMKTMFYVESGLQVSSSSPEQGGLGGTGATNNGPGPLGNVRQAFLGLGSKYGNLTAGWQYTPEYFQRTTNIGGSANTLGIAATTASNGGIAVASRGTLDSMNAFKYESPKFFDTTFTAMVGTSNTTQTSAYGVSTSAAATAQSLNASAVGGGQNITSTGLGQALAANWSKGNAQGTLSYSKEKVINSNAYYYTNGGMAINPVTVTTVATGSSVTYTGATIATANTTQQNFMASGSYDFGIVKVMGIAANRRTTANATSAVTNVDIYNVGALVPVTPTIKLGANYAYAHAGASGKDSKNQAFQASVQYSLSKRTTAYALASRAVMSDIGAAASAITSTVTTSANQYSLGLAHTF